MDKAKVVVISGFSTEWTKEITGIAPDGFATAVLSNDSPDAEKIAALRDADFLLLQPGPISEQVMRAATKLRLVQLLRVGYELVDLKLLEELGIAFANLRDATAGIVADHAVLLMLAVYRNLVVADQSVRKGRWGDLIWDRKAYEMEDKTVGILGLGNIGRQVVRRVHGFGCHVQYHNRRRLPEEEERRLGVRFVSLPDLLATSDILSLHVPITGETRHLLGREELRQMKPTAIIVNTARGGVLDQEALVEALQKGWIAGAGLDVFDPQPPSPDSPLLTLDNVVLTPYIASETQEKARRIASFAWRNVRAVWEGKAPEGMVLAGRRL